MSARYPAARAFAGRLQEHFSRYAGSGGPLPDARAIEALVDAGFWASLQREEGYAPEISLAFLPPERAVRPLLFASPLPLGSRALARLAPAVERPGIHLGVWREKDGYSVWGTTRVLPSFCFVLEVRAPGLLVVKHRLQGDSGKFRNVAVFEGEGVKMVSREVAEYPDHPAAIGALIAPEAGSGEGHQDVLLRLAVSMRVHGRGGTLLVVPSDSETWRESIVRPIAYAVAPPFTELAELARAAAGEEAAAAHADLARVVDEIAGLTQVDGATVISDRYELLAFGVKIGRPDGRSRVERIVLSEPIEGAQPVELAPIELGGTRHSSAAQFAHDQHDAVALVASQDDRFTAFAWSLRQRMVHAHRLETLLL
jgi:hypothetical protein